MPAPKPVIDWESVEREYRAGNLSVRKIGRLHGVSDAGIRKRAKIGDWARALIDRATAREFDRYGSREAGVSQFVRSMFDEERLADLLGSPPILHGEAEYPLPRGRADFAFFHTDGSISIVEAKARGGLRDMLAGIGQLMSYGVQAAYSGRRVRLFLVIDIEDSAIDAMALDEACSAACVQFVPIGRLTNQDAVAAEARHAA